MQARMLRSPAVLVGGFALVAVVTGLVVSLLEPKWAVAGIIAALAIGLVLYDYRVGVVCLTLLLPWYSSPLIPQTQGFNLVSFMIAASVFSLLLSRGFRWGTLVSLPSVFKWCYLLPVAIAAVVALPYLHIGAANYPAVMPDYYQAYAPGEFLKSRVIKPLFFVVFSFLLANAVRDSEKQERFLVAFVVSAVLPALSILITVVTQGGNVTQRDSYLQGLGFHPNALGMLLALTTGPLLFLTTEATSRPAKAGCALALLLVAAGLLLTGSRGAALAFIVVIVFWLIRRRRLSDLFVALLIGALLILAIPDNVWDRLALGLDDTEATNVHNLDDPLTKGRLASWAMLAPGILQSPIWGRGIGSVAWNEATSAGLYGATLSHNMYLDILLDMGVVGFALMMYLYFRYIRGFMRLSSDQTMSPTMRAYYIGGLASFLGMCAMALTNGVYMPQTESAFLWFSLGMLFAHWGSATRSEGNHYSIEPSRGAPLASILSRRR